MLPLKSGTGHHSHTDEEAGIHSVIALDSAPSLAYLKHSPAVRSVARTSWGPRQGSGAVKVSRFCRESRQKGKDRLFARELTECVN